MTQQEVIARIIRQGLAEWQTNSIAGMQAPRSRVPELHTGPTYKQRTTQEADIYNKLQRMRAWSSDLDNAFTDNPLLALGQAKAAGVDARPIQASPPQALVQLLTRLQQKKGREPANWHRAAPPIFGPAKSIWNTLLPELEGPVGGFLDDPHMGMVLSKGNVQKHSIYRANLLPGGRRISPMGDVERPLNAPEPRLDALINRELSRARRETFTNPAGVSLPLLQMLVRLGTKTPLNLSEVKGRYPTMFPEAPMSPLQELLLKAGIKGPMYPQSPPWMYSPPGALSDIYTTPSIMKTWLSKDLVRTGLKPAIAFSAPEGTIIRHPVSDELLQKGPYQRWHRLSGFGLMEGE